MTYYNNCPICHHPITTGGCGCNQFTGTIPANRMVELHDETRDERELRLLRELQSAVTAYVRPLAPNRPCISLDTLRQTLMRIKREIEHG